MGIPCIFEFVLVKIITDVKVPLVASDRRTSSDLGMALYFPSGWRENLQDIPIYAYAAYIYIYIYIHDYTYINIYIYIYTYKIYIYIHIYIYEYIYIYTYNYIYIYICVYIYRYVCVLSPCSHVSFPWRPIFWWPLTTWKCPKTLPWWGSSATGLREGIYCSSTSGGFERA